MARLRLLFLAPLAVAIFAIITAMVLALCWHEDQSIRQDMQRIRASAQNFYQDSIRTDTRTLRAVTEILLRDASLHASLASGDRQQLLTRATILFEALKKDYAITHLYFSGPDRVNLLRVHAPNIHGDRIDRLTTLAAEQSGMPSVGVELGPLGTFTLRLVTPWYDEATRQLIGYVELGVEIDHVLQKLRDFFGVEVFVLIDKEYLDRKKWEDAMRSLGHATDWDRFPSVVLGRQATQTVPFRLAEHLDRKQLGEVNSIFETEEGNIPYRITFLPLQDTAGHNIAHMALIANVSQETNAAFNTVYAGGLAALAIGTLLLGFFQRQIVRVGRRIERDAQALEQLATHDGLTGLYNHRAFYLILDNEVARAQRYRHPLSLLMIDIDHFKHVNDTHGHLVGDAILRGVGERLTDLVRTVDRVCRYGGEEIAVILPNTDSPLDLAERLRTAIEATPFDSGSGKDVHITVSIGLACFFSDADTGQALVSAADTALCKAKREGRNRVVETSSPDSRPADY